MSTTPAGVRVGIVDVPGHERFVKTMVAGVGGIDIVVLVIAVIGVILLGVGTVFEKTSLVETYIDESVQGLDVGSAVKFRGVPIGKVEKISLTSAEYATRKRYVLVRTHEMTRAS